jgi:intracellular multiplication protein IcmD
MRSDLGCMEARVFFLILMLEVYIMKFLTKHSKFFLFIGLMVVSLFCKVAFAADDNTIGDVADTVTGSFKQIGALMIAASYIAGFGLVCASMFKFKAHKDNPTQVPLSTAVALFGIGALLAFLPAILRPAGVTVFGADVQSGGFQGQGVDVIDEYGEPTE